MKILGTNEGCVGNILGVYDQFYINTVNRFFDSKLKWFARKNHLKAENRPLNLLGIGKRGFLK